MIENRGFETADSSLALPGIPAVWSSMALGTVEAFAVFAGDSSLLWSSVETFDHGWGLLNPQALLTSLVTTEHAVTEIFSAWLEGLQYIAIGPLESAALGDASTESFSSWFTYDPSIDTYDVALEAGIREDFSSWGYVSLSLTSIAHAVFDTAKNTLSGQVAETFTLRAPIVVSPFPPDVFHIVDNTTYPGATNDKVTLLTQEGRLPTPFLESTPYWVSSFSGSYFKLKATLSSTVALALSDEGAGYILLAYDPGRFWTEELPT